MKRSRVRRSIFGQKIKSSPDDWKKPVKGWVHAYSLGPKPRGCVVELSISWPLDMETFSEYTGKVYVAAGVYKNEWKNTTRRRLDLPPGEGRVLRKKAKYKTVTEKVLTYRPTGRAEDIGSGCGPFDLKRWPKVRRDVEIGFKTTAQAMAAATKIAKLGIKGLTLVLTTHQKFNLYPKELLS